MTSVEDFGGWAALNLSNFFQLFFFFQGKNIFPPKGEILSEILSEMTSIKEEGFGKV